MTVKNLLSKNFAFFSYDFVVQTSPGFDGLDNPSNKGGSSTSLRDYLKTCTNPTEGLNLWHQEPREGKVLAERDHEGELGLRSGKL